MEENTHEELIRYIKENIITDPEEYIESYDEIKRVAAKPEHIKLYKFIQELEEEPEPQPVLEDIHELKKALSDSITREFDFYDILSNHGKLWK